MDRRAFLHLSFLAAAALALGACTGGGGISAGPQPQATVLEVARGAGLNRFGSAVDTAGLTETLSGPGPFTVFAPSDAALTAAGRMDAATLRRVLAYHVVPGQLTTDFLNGMNVNHTTLLGSGLNIDGEGPLRVNGANVMSSDLLAANGVVFVIDRVLTPR